MDEFHDFELQFDGSIVSMQLDFVVSLIREKAVFAIVVVMIEDLFLLCSCTGIIFNYYELRCVP